MEDGPARCEAQINVTASKERGYEMKYSPACSFLLTLVTIAIMVSVSCCANHQKEAVTERIRNRLETAGYQLVIEIQDEVIHASQVLPAFYEQRGFEPAWSDGQKPLPQVKTLLSTISEANREGLQPQDYHLQK